jgi:iron(III) transport system ATP-binding protein
MITVAAQEGTEDAVAGPSMITVRGLVNQFVTDRGTVNAVRDVSFDVRPGEFYTLLGPSGCGKTTSLRSIAGLETPVDGEIVLDGRTVFADGGQLNVPVHQRGVGMVFQSYAIWPHMTVFDNLAYPLRYGPGKRPSKAEITERVETVLRLVQMESMGDRKATELSGGQQQRVALARAVARGPQVLLLDEPLSNLDARLRGDMRSELKELLGRLGTTAIYVTHDQVEALSMSDRIAVMNQGKIVQEGPPEELYLRPRDRFVASFIGEMNLIPGTLAQCDRDTHRCVVETPAGRIDCVPAGDDLAPGTAVEVGVRPENLSFDDGSGCPGGGLSLRGTLRTRTFVGDAILSTIDVAGATLEVKSHPGAGLPSAPGPIELVATSDHCIAFAASTAETVTHPEEH